MTKKYVDLQVKDPLFLSDFNETEVSRKSFEKSQISKYIKICTVGVELFHEEGRTGRWTDGHTYILRNITKASK